MVGSFYQAIRRNLARLVSQRGSCTVAIALSAWSCQASVKGDANAHVRHDAEEGPDDAHDLNKPISAKALAASSAATTVNGAPTLLGARPDMNLVVEHAKVACTCLKVAIGSASSAAFRWQGSVPQLNDDTQLAVALSSESMPCQNEPKGSSGASYWGYRISGNDVIVFVEGARAGRPRTAAAIIPKPVADGQVYVAPAPGKAKLPYGRPLDGKGSKCTIGNVATKRLTPFTAGELGDTILRDPDAVPSVDTGD